MSSIETITDSTILRTAGSITFASNVKAYVEANIDHGSIQGLGDDDHTQYILVDGTRDFTGNITTKGRKKELTAQAGNYTVLATDEVVVFSITASNSLATLIDPTTNSGQVFSLVNKYSSTKTLTFSEDIDGDSTLALVAGENITIISDGVEYLIYE